MLPAISCGDPPSQFLKHGSGITTILIPGFDYDSLGERPFFRGKAVFLQGAVSVQFHVSWWEGTKMAPW